MWVANSDCTFPGEESLYQVDNLWKQPHVQLKYFSKFSESQGVFHLYLNFQHIKKKISFNCLLQELICMEAYL